ncbi:MAG: polyprenyl synthetase family protein [Gammaproteobacteria bacterium]
MDPKSRVEEALEGALGLASADDGPPLLRAAMRHAVFPGGARVRPRLCLAVAHACGGCDPGLEDAAAAAIELLHCASLVHDDLPCFDDADLRRGRPAVHRAFGEPLAVLAGDALIVLAFQLLAARGAHAPPAFATLVGIIAGAVGAPHGIAAGQAWEAEADVALMHYERAKTGALFAAATAAGAVAAGAEPTPWRAVGERIGEAFQVADDMLDLAGDSSTLGKPTGQDAAHGRPNVALVHGMRAARRQLEAAVAAALAAIPSCPGQAALCALLAAEARQFVPAAVWQSAA